jgi:hypothetical protein
MNFTSDSLSNSTRTANANSTAASNQMGADDKGIRIFLVFVYIFGRLASLSTLFIWWKMLTGKCKINDCEKCNPSKDDDYDGIIG